MQVGNEVHVVRSGNMPLILRKSHDVSNIHPCHTIIGEFYLDDIMDGEASNDLETNAVEVFLV